MPNISVKNVLVVSIFAVRSGISEAARLLVHELRDAGFKVFTHDVSEALQLKISVDDLCNQPPVEPPDAVIYHLNPPQIDAILPYLPRTLLQAPVRIGYWAWELEELPPSWKTKAKFFHSLWTPSAFVASAVKHSLPNASVEIVPHAAGLRDNLPTVTRGGARSQLNLTTGDFVVGQSFAITSGIYRKNPADALRAFSRAFSENEHAVLLLRCIDASLHPLLHEELRVMASNLRCRVCFVGAEVPIQSFYRSLDVYLSLHRSEGFGLNLAEAMLAGLPVVATGWSGNLEFMTPEVAMLTSFELVEVDDPQNAYVAPHLRWAQPDIENAASLLRSIYENRSLGENLGKRASAFAEKKLRGGAAARALMAFSDVPVGRPR